MIPSPNACHLCDEDERDHARVWHPAVGFHNWVEPTAAQRLMRMKARRFFRLQREKGKHGSSAGDRPDGGGGSDPAADVSGVRKGVIMNGL